MAKNKHKDVSRTSKSIKTVSRKIKKRGGKKNMQSKKPFNKLKRSHNTHSPISKHFNEQTSKLHPKNAKGSNNSKPDKFRMKKKSQKTVEEDGDSDFEVITSKKLENKRAVVSDTESSDVDEEVETKTLVKQQNRKKKKAGGFQSMGFSNAVSKGITRKGYKLPTPIQRKAIPIISEGKDVVAMARTGSGKTAAFLLPMFEKLKTHTAKSGARALILSPTRELALQTLRFTKELGKFTGLKAAIILGGDRMEDQFSALHENPDIIIATPGRLMHILVEMNLKLKSVEYAVFDEADRLFEMGFQEQLNEIISTLPEARQTLLFSATLPKLLVEFAKAGLHDPTLIRLDVETKISEHLKMSFFHCRADDKPAILLYMLRDIIPPNEQTVIFTATKHHVEYLSLILQKADIACTQVYSSLDPTARKINVAKFHQKRVTVMVVTDLAARGIDIPLLDNVINYHFPAKAKLFVHRVGRVARAGRTGTAFSLVSADETAYMYDLHVFLGRPVNPIFDGKPVPDDNGLYGRIPQTIVDDVNQDLIVWHKDILDMESMKKVSGNAYKQYIKSRQTPAPESIKRLKEMDRSGSVLGIHPVFKSHEKDEDDRQQLLNNLKTYKSRATIFEVNATSKTKAFEVMKVKRVKHDTSIEMSQQRREDRRDDTGVGSVNLRPSQQENTNEDDLSNVFRVVIGSKRPSSHPLNPGKKKRKIDIKDTENYLNYKPADFQTEKGLSLGTSFDQEAAGLTLDLGGDDENAIKKQMHQMKWDRRKKKYVRDSGQDGKKKIRTESGVLISSSYKSNAYKDWLEKSKEGDDDDDDDDDNDSDASVEKKKVIQENSNRLIVVGTKGRRWHTKGSEKTPGSSYKKGKFKAGKSELKRPEQIMKARKMKAKKQSFEKFRQQKKNKRKMSMTKKAKK